MESRRLQPSRFRSPYSNPIPLPVDAVIRRASILLSALLVALCVADAVAQTPAVAPDLKTLINNLSSLEYGSRMNAARQIRRASPAQAVPALVDAVRRHPD